MSASARVLLTLSLLSFLLAGAVIGLGAYVRLSNAGLGCPDWPGCYGRLFIGADMPPPAAIQVDPARPFHSGKAFREMLHRYAAGSLGLMIVLLAGLLWLTRPRQRALAGLLLGLVLAQVLLGMWTVTELLKPLIVSAHLLGGMAILALLYWLLLTQLPVAAPAPGSRLAALSLAGLAALAVQMFLGGWTAANYAALACPEFPLCRDGQWWPETDFREAFVIWREGRMNYEGGILDAPARTAIHLAHRLGAALAALAVLAAALAAFVRPERLMRPGAVLLLCVLCLQLSLGVANVLLRLPVPVALAHNAGAALLMLLLLTLYRYSRGKPG